MLFKTRSSWHSALLFTKLSRLLPGVAEKQLRISTLSPEKNVLRNYQYAASCYLLMPLAIEIGELGQKYILIELIQSNPTPLQAETPFLRSEKHSQSEHEGACMATPACVPD